VENLFGKEDGIHGPHEVVEGAYRVAFERESAPRNNCTLGFEEYDLSSLPAAVVITTTTSWGAAKWSPQCCTLSNEAVETSSLVSRYILVTPTIGTNVALCTLDIFCDVAKDLFSQPLF
jgi:hypothetical protein